MRRYEMTAHDRGFDTWYSMDPDTLGDYVTYEDAIAAIEAAYREGWRVGSIRGFNGNDTCANQDADWTTSNAKRKAESSDE